MVCTCTYTRSAHYAGLGAWLTISTEERTKLTKTLPKLARYRASQRLQIYIYAYYIYINPGILQPAQVMPYWSRGEVGVVRQPLEDQTRSQAFIFMRQCFKIGVGRIFGGVLEGALCCHSECSGEDQLGGASSSVHQSGYLSAVWGFIN